MVLFNFFSALRCYAVTHRRTRTIPFMTATVMTFLLTAGCANPFPKGLLAKVEKNVSYREFQDDPEKYDGNLLMFGGEIIETKNREDGAWIVVLQKPLNEEGRPNWTTESGGRFLVATSSFLDVEAFRRGRSITVIGEVDNSKGLPVRGTEYWYPFLVAKQLYLW
jgi:outer membrane lipoprotein